MDLDGNHQHRTLPLQPYTQLSALKRYVRLRRPWIFGKRSPHFASFWAFILHKLLLAAPELAILRSNDSSVNLDLLWPHHSRRLFLVWQMLHLWRQLTNLFRLCRDRQSSHFALILLNYGRKTPLLWSRSQANSQYVAKLAGRKDALMLLDICCCCVIKTISKKKNNRRLCPGRSAHGSPSFPPIKLNQRMAKDHSILYRTSYLVLYNLFHLNPSCSSR